MSTERSIWRVRLLGGFEARHGDRVVSRFKTHKTALLLARLALSGGREHAHESLAALLWPGSEPEPGRARSRRAPGPPLRAEKNPGRPRARTRVRTRPESV